MAVGDIYPSALCHLIQLHKLLLCCIPSHAVHSKVHSCGDGRNSPCLSVLLSRHLPNLASSCLYLLTYSCDWVKADSASYTHMPTGSAAESLSGTQTAFPSLHRHLEERGATCNKPRKLSGSLLLCAAKTIVLHASQGSGPTCLRFDLTQLQTTLRSQAHRRRYLPHRRYKPRDRTLHCKGFSCARTEGAELVHAP